MKKTPLKRKKPKVRSVSSLKKELDSWFSKFIRYRDEGICYTCNLQRHPKEMQNGHFVPRQYLAVRYDERNCHCQCYACNMLYNGQPSRYAMNLERDYGQGIVAVLESLRQKITKDYPYLSEIERYKSLVLQQEKDF